jgi:FlaA1/EpsC-like NDP-sugar epimerase
VRVLVTGSDGYLGRMVCRLLTMRGHTPIGFDLPQDVLTHTIPEADACIHLAANKYATHAEENPAETAHLNIAGTQRIVQHIPRTVLASTCKAAAPITSYGASKLIAERITLNAGGSVVRLVNVLGSTGSVTDIWDATPKGQPLPVTNCKRMFITPGQAARLLTTALTLDPGRYGPRLVKHHTPRELANLLHPGRDTVTVPLRFGDRPVEQLTNEWETTVPVTPHTVRILDCWERNTMKEAA